MVVDSNISEVSTLSAYEDVDRFMEGLAGKCVHLPYIRGNNGDRLLEIALSNSLAKHGVKVVKTPSRADWILLRGSGAMNDFWCDGVEWVQFYTRHHPHIPLAVLPSSYHFERTDFRKILLEHRAPVVLFAREYASLGRLHEMGLPANVTISLDHDMAISLRGSSLVRRWGQRRNSLPCDYILVVERHDVEHHDSTAPLSAEPAIQLPSPLRQDLERRVRPMRDRCIRARWRLMHALGKEPISRAFADECQQVIGNRFPQMYNLPWYTGDISKQHRYSFNQFCRLVAGAAMVISTRLHVAIFSSLLGIPTVLRAGRYGKIQGIYDYSLERDPNVYLVGSAGDLLEGARKNI